MINLSSISHHYPKGQTIKFPDWSIEDKEQWLLLGASGSGKSTLLNIISGLLKPTEGAVNFNDVNLYNLPAKEMDKFRGQKIGIVFQRPHLIRSLTVLENLEIAASMADCKFDRPRILSSLNDLGLVEKINNYPDELSQGQLQRVSVARALVNKPTLLIADEPTSSLDDDNTIQVLEMLISQAKNNDAALIIATHDQRVRNHISKAYLL